MDGFYFSVNKNNGRTLCISHLTNRRIAAADQAIPDPSGYYLYEKCGSDENAEVKIIAQVMSEEAALMLQKAFNMI